MDPSESWIDRDEAHNAKYRRLPFTTTPSKEPHVVLAGRCFLPAGAADPQFTPPELGSRPVVVLVHQYSKMGGNSSLMEGIGSKLATQFSVPAVSFDCRGVGLSTGRATYFGTAEVADVVAVCSWVKDHLQASNIVVLGSSAGACIAGSAVEALQEISAYVGIGYTFGFIAQLIFGHHRSAIMKTRKPKLFIHGDQDGFTSTKRFCDVFQKLEHPKEKLIVRGVGHFELEAPHFDLEIARTVAQFVKKHVDGSNPDDV